jgi:hypothetical protein
MSLKEKIKFLTTIPVDPDLFVWCCNVYQAAANLSMPVDNPESLAKFSAGERGYVLSDIPLNRGMLAVMKELDDRAIGDDERMAMSWRIMHYGQIFDHIDKLGEFIKEGDTPDSVMVSEALIKACASARFIESEDNLHLDVDDIIRIAREITILDDKESLD